MNRSILLPLASLVLAASLVAPAAAAAASNHPDQLVILSTVDRKGMINPCGCHIPKGGFARLAAFADSIRGTYANALLVDDGGFFAEEPERASYIPVVMDGMKSTGVQVVGLGDRDLRMGLAYLRSQLKRTGLTAVCANLLDKQSRQPAFTPYVLRKAGSVTVGVLGLISDRADLGPARDSLVMQDPDEVAKKLVPEMRAKGATVVVVLSQLGKVPSDDLANGMDGIDVVVAGRNVPLMQKGKLVRNTVVVYGGDQGNYAVRTLLTLDPTGHAIDRDSDAVMLGPDIKPRHDLEKTMNDFEAKFTAAQAKNAPPSVPAEAPSH
jgi:2',3'-cyclic-nucleotide 2'-phosphodiesterase (5'-nucleotidase family)